MLTGQSGVKYGLTVPKREAKKVLKKVNVFGGDDDSDDERQQVAKQIERQAQQKQTDKKVCDPNVQSFNSYFVSCFYIVQPLTREAEILLDVFALCSDL